MLHFDFLEKGLGIASSPGFFKENVSHVILYELTKLHCLIAFTSRDIGQYVYCSCFLTRW